MASDKKYFKTHKAALKDNEKRTKSLGWNNRTILMPESKYNKTKKYATWK